MNPIAIGRLLRSNTMGCVIGCKLTQSDTPSFGDMLRIPLTDGSQLYGLVYDIHIDDDGLVRQLITAPDVPTEIIEDNRRNRNVPLEMSVVFIGWQANGSISQTRVPRPPLTLDEIFPCGDDEMLQFINSGKFGYLRTILRNQELPAADLVTAHLRQVLKLRPSASSDAWAQRALTEIIALLKDDYPQLMDVLGAVSEIA